MKTIKWRFFFRFLSPSPYLSLFLSLIFFVLLQNCAHSFVCCLLDIEFVQRNLCLMAITLYWDECMWGIYYVLRFISDSANVFDELWYLILHFIKCLMTNKMNIELNGKRCEAVKCACVSMCPCAITYHNVI